jgi:GNAT superfamily N-acetyltransferase
VGGLRGDTHWGWLFVGKMAIRAEGRNQGYGTRLLALAEQEARARGCHHAYVDTLSFQALPFYQKQGYTVFGTLDCCPGEHKQYYLQKEL